MKNIDFVIDLLFLVYSVYCFLFALLKLNNEKLKKELYAFSVVSIIASIIKIYMDSIK